MVGKQCRTNNQVVCVLFCTLGKAPGCCLPSGGALDTAVHLLGAHALCIRLGGRS